MLEPNIETQEKDFDAVLDEKLDEWEGKENPTPSSEEKPTEPKTEETKDAGDDQPKKSKSEEEPEKGTEEDIDPQDKAFREKWNKAKEKIEAEHRKELESLKENMLSKEEIESFRNITSSPTYIRESMRAQGFKDEVIDQELQKRGFNVPARDVDDVQLVAKELNIAQEQMTPEMRGYISDIAKVARVIFKNDLNQILPNTIKPLETSLDQINRDREGSKVFNEIQKIVKDEGVLDFEKDVEPDLHRWLDQNKDSTFDDFRYFFNNLNHLKTLERLKLGKHRKEQETSKEKNRSLKDGLPNKTGVLPPLTGDTDKDLDAALDALGIH